MFNTLEILKEYLDYCNFQKQYYEQMAKYQTDDKKIAFKAKVEAYDDMISEINKALYL